MSQPIHPNEGIVIVNKRTGRMVLGLAGGRTRRAIISANLDRKKYRVMYAGDYYEHLDEQNQQNLQEDPHA